MLMSLSPRYALNSHLHQLHNVIDLQLITVAANGIEEVTLAPGAGGDQGFRAGQEFRTSLK